MADLLCKCTALESWPLVVDVIGEAVVMHIQKRVQCCFRVDLVNGRPVDVGVHLFSFCLFRMQG